MANINIKPSKYMLNLLHVLPAFVSEEEGIINAIVENNAKLINKYELITETGTLKLDRVGYSSLAYPFSYGAIPSTWDLDNDPLDVEIINLTEDILPGTLVELRIIGVMKFVDGGEVDDKIIAVVNDDKRQDHITDIAQLGEYWQKETTHFWEYYKYLKKPGTGKVEGFFGKEEAVKIIKECEERYREEYLPKFD
ncbi:inorganic diphosphatase [Candidatus Gracilibacteria bacterium]|nr:inorganic diphosphatase [Candidatus Gracilibacteria bacterium]NUJ98851.1 inorganic diphosphatase [Candidatus Gracilibacteria bacterium]